jgi:DNA-binding SARP family transcriptional activator
MYSYSLEKGQMTGARWADGRTALLPAGNQSIYSPVTRHLYNLYIDQQKVRTYDPNSGKWDNNFSPGPLTEFWHANKFLSYADSSLYMIDGYGQLKYKNGVQRYRFADKKWEIVQTGGDYFTPRYLAALGTNSRGDTAYIMGGYGSTTGDQMVNPRYWYDLLEYSVKDRTFKTLYHFKEPEEPFCFANSLIIDSATGQYYALIYPNDKFNSRLQLISGSLRAPGYRLLGDAIPYSFHDIKSFADLYYCPASKQLVAVTLYTSKDNRTEVKIYTIAFPPNALMPVVVVERKSFPWIYLLGIIPLAALGWWAVSRYRRGARRVPIEVVLAGGSPVTEVHTEVALPDPPAPIAVEDTASALSRIYCFGQFEVYDKAGQDLSRQFTPLLKELFLLIAIYSLRSGKGISSEKLYATLWRDKSNKDAQNNRSVNMVKLKVILDKLGTCGIVKEADKWVFHYAADQIRIDLAEFLVLIGHPQPDKELIRRLLGIIHKGAFLSDTAYPWLDDIKSEISDKALDCLSAASLRFSADKEFLLEIASGIFLFDPVNEEALKVKCKSLGALGRHSLAKAAFEKFAKEYQLMYGEEFQQTFHEILAD